MDTPERNQIGSTSVSKFEDSPVFNYINSLSPIKTVKSTHITQPFNPLSFAALPSIFTSPHVSSHKESRFLRRHNSYSDPSEPQLPSDKGNKGCADGVVMNVSQHYNNSTGPPENFNSGVSMSSLSIEPLSDHAKSIEELQSMNCYTGSSSSNPTNPSVIQADGLLQFVNTSDLIVSNKKHPENCSSEHRREGMEYDWEGFSTDGADLLIFTSPNGSEAMSLMQKALEPLEGFSPIMAGQNDSNNMQLVKIVDPADPCGQHEAEEPFSHHAGDCELDEREKLDTVTYSHSEKCMAHYTGENLDNGPSDCQIYCEPISNLHRGMRRRCLDFETVGIQKNLGESSCNSMVSHDDGNLVSNNKQLLRSKSVGSSSHIVNGIGLHLNALATSSKGYKDVNHESLLYGRQLSLPSSIPRYPSPTTEEEPLLPLAVLEKDAEPSENGVQMDEDTSHASAYVLGEDSNQNSPKKKRRREHSGESEACKRCNCKKSKCLKLYCECFAAGVYCIEPCSCQECFNKPIHEDTVLATRKQIESRNPLAFAPKVIRNSDSVPEPGDEPSKTPASARHKRGCNCKKSSCLKKYCECYQGGVGCSISCRCEGCKNAFGRKDGSALMDIETEQDEEETEATVQSVMKKPSLVGTEIQTYEEQNPRSLLPTTPLQLCRPMVPLPFSSRTKLGSSFLIGGSSSGLYAGQKLDKPIILRPQPKFDKQLKTVMEDETPEILRLDSSPSTSVKTSSPNSKRISPPHSEFGSSPVPRTGRKLILQSIPSFPSLTPQH